MQLPPIHENGAPNIVFKKSENQKPATPSDEQIRKGKIRDKIQRIDDERRFRNEMKGLML